MKFRLIISLVFALCSFTALAEQDEAAATKQQADVTPDALIQAIAQELIRNIQTQRDELGENPDKLYAMVDEVVLPHFDFPLMSRLVLGPAWEKADDSQQERFLNGFKTLLVKTYSNALLQYSNQEVSFDPAVPGKKPTRASVKSTIQSAGADPVYMHYRLRKKGQQWLVYDVVVDNISLITNYRGTYAAEVKRNGLDSLIEKLSEQSAS